MMRRLVGAVLCFLGMHGRRERMAVGYHLLDGPGSRVWYGRPRPAEEKSIDSYIASLGMTMLSDVCCRCGNRRPANWRRNT